MEEYGRDFRYSFNFSYEEDRIVIVTGRMVNGRFIMVEEVIYHEGSKKRPYKLKETNCWKR